jgi:hypothetical protein
VSGTLARLGDVARWLATARFLNRHRAIGWSAVLLFEQVLMFAFLVLWTHGAIRKLDAPITTDFASFFAAGRLALGVAPQLVYDHAAHYLAEQQATAAGVGYSFFFYPPVFLLLCAPLALLPYLPAFLLFEGVSLVLYVMVALRVLGPVATPRRWVWCIPVLAFPSVAWTLGIGQNSLLSAALFGGGLLLLERRPVLAGVLLGALIYKPHFGLLLPLALLAGRHWRAMAGAAGAVAALVLLSLALFGWQTWQDYLTAFLQSGDVYASGKVTLGGYVTVFGAALLMGAPPATATAIQIVVAVPVAVAVAVLWHRTTALPVRAAALLSGTLLCVPLALFYDLLLVAIAIFFLVRHGRAHGFLPGERLVLAAIYMVALVSRYVGEGLHLPLGLLAVAAVFGFAVAHGLRAPLASPVLSARAGLGAMAARPL